MPELFLARMQFAANITFHILFPTITIALAWILLFFRLRYNSTGDEKWQQAYSLYVKLFALCFALGVVSGITMSFQFGTNWPGFMQKVGNVAGPLLAYEILSAFFLEATFLGVMLFGSCRVSNKMHLLATALVAIGTTLSAFWILALNSWMNTPTGFEIKDGVVYVLSWYDVVFNPSTVYRLAHMLLASGLTAAFFVAGISAYQWLRQNKNPAVMAAMKTGVYTAVFLILLQFVVGDMHGLNTLHHQPQKVAAIEGIWHSEKSAAFRLFAIPDEQNRNNDFEIKIPYLASLILTHKLDGEVLGLNEFKHHPPVAPVFFSFRIMLGIGGLMLLISLLSSWQIYFRGAPSKFIARALVVMTFSDWVATLAGWYTTEIGRQPWLVQNVLLTADAVSNVPAKMLITTLVAYLITYCFLLVAFISTVFYLARQDGKPKFIERR